MPKINGGFRRIFSSDGTSLVRPREVVIEGVKVALPVSANIANEAPIELHNEASEVVEVVAINLERALFHSVPAKHFE